MTGCNVWYLKGVEEGERKGVSRLMATGVRRYPTIPPRVTVEWLQERGACPNQVRRFKRLWPDGARVTKTNLLEAAERGLDLWWFGRKIYAPDKVYAKANRYWNEIGMRMGFSCRHARLCNHEREYYRRVVPPLWQYIKEARRAKMTTIVTHRPPDVL